MDHERLYQYMLGIVSDMRRKGKFWNSDHEDHVIDALTNAIMKADMSMDDKAIFSYLGKKAKFSSIDYLRHITGHRCKSERPISVQFSAMESNEAYDAKSKHLSQQDLLDGEDAVRSVSSVMGDKERRILELKMQGMTSSEVGRKVGISSARVCQIITAMRSRPTVQKLAREYGFVA